MSGQAWAATKTPIVDSGERYVAGQTLAENYHLGAGDKVKVNVFNEPQLSGEYQVAPDGTISLPLVGVLSVIDKTTAQVAAAFEEMLGQDYLRNPKVAAEVTLYRPFFIVGEVHMPGQYPYAAGLTAWNAIATAQGLTPRGREGYVYIRKYGSAEEVRYALTPDLRVWPGDTIRVAERFF
ncbi:polysaccharide biosynthesis/export family protein [Novosphingobium rosa]|uniref:polysaccharide biosynthesis/export family protein n=1 Tax=Novosphingobium rosa TaxID=76978 RepID=UPI001FDEC7C6|nr:polysaccharide biosynthesis/export family protein [Novosphingobium rosa]